MGIQAPARDYSCFQSRIGDHFLRMKILLLTILLCFTGSEAERHQTRNIGNLWNNFEEVTKLHDVVERMKVLVREEDEPMLILSDFFKGTEFRSIATCLRESPDYVDFYNFLQENGLNLADIFQWVNDELEWGEYQPPTDRNDPRTMKDLWDDLVGVIPYSDYLAWFLEQYAINPDMQTLIARLQSKGSENIRDHLHTCEAYLNYRCWFIGEDIDLVSLEEKGCSFLGWSDCTTPTC